MAAAAPSARLGDLVAWRSCGCQQPKLHPLRLSREHTHHAPKAASRPLITAVSPSCRIRTRHSSGNHRKAQQQSRKSLSDRPPAAEEESGKGGSAGLELDEDVDVTADQALSVQTAVQPLGSQKAGVVEVPTRGVSVDDLMDMIKDAEKNILLLNQVRARALEELDKARSDKEFLQGQVNILQTRLAEADAKLKLAAQTKAKNEVLEEELGLVRSRLADRDGPAAGKSNLEADYRKLQLQVLNLEAQLQASQASAEEVSSLRSQAESLEQQLKLVRSTSAAELLVKDRVNAQVQTANAQLQDYVNDLEDKLAVAEAKLLQLPPLGIGEDLMMDAADLTGTEAGADREGDVASNAEVASLRAKVAQLQISLLQAEQDRVVLEKSQAENVRLRDQVQLLEQRLQESDAEIRSQLEQYQAEVESFQTSLQRVKSKQGGAAEVPVGEMPWDFWTRMLLRIDALMLSKQISIEEGRELRIMAWRREARIRDAFVVAEDESDERVIASLLQLTKARQKPGLHVVHIAAEMAPVAKVGGLGDVVTGLGKALQAKGHLVEVILPKYNCMDYSRIKLLKVLDMELLSYFDGQMHKNRVWHGIVEGLPVYFIEPLHHQRFFWRGAFYGENDDFRRFTYFCRAALEFILQAGRKPDIIHSHDWQTAIVAPLYWDVYVPQGLDSARLAFTCHNFEYQGTESPAGIAACGLVPQQHHRQDRMQDSFFHDRINLLKGGIVFSNIVTTVSPTYAEEVRGPEGGRGLHVTIASHAAKFVGILNGIDDEAWDPCNDPLLDFPFSADDLSGKLANKKSLRTRLGLAGTGSDEGRPLVGCITRLVPQKGVHLIRHAIYRTLELGGQFVLLGSSPVADIQREFEGIARSFENHPHVRLVLKYDETLSHSIYAASDAFVIPSLFEPCGLTQMISMRYGAIPVARKTGGLADSVFDVDDGSIGEDRRNGFTFTAANEEGLNYALERCVRYYQERPAWWRELVRTSMRMDFSWRTSADQYVRLYTQSVERARSRGSAN